MAGKGANDVARNRKIHRTHDHANRTPDSEALNRLLRPRTIAVIGGGAWCEAVVEQCVNSGFDGELLAVHPRRSELAGVKAVADVQSLPWAPDACFIGVNRRITVQMLSELSSRGAGGAVCFASGFLESEDTDGAGLQAELIRAAGDMAILGPNCYGFINNLDGSVLWPDQHGLESEERGVAILTQSSNIAINLTMQHRGVPIAYVITTGNQAQQEIAMIATSLLADPRVTAIGLHIEGVKDALVFERFVRAAHERNVPVAALKVGASVEAQLATQSHTASVAGTDAGAQALLQRLGVASVNTLPELLEILKLMHVYGSLPGGRLASLSCSGGEASLLADCVHRIDGLSLPPVPDTASAVLHAHLGPHVTKVNPLDYHTDIWRDRKAMATVFGAMTGEPYDLTLLVLDFPRADRCSDADWLIAIDAIVDASKQPGARVAVIASLAENIPEHHNRTLMNAGVAALMEFDVALCALASLVACKKPVDAPLWPPRLATPKTDTRSSLADEATAKQMLASHGVTVPAHQRVSSTTEIRHAASVLNAPWVLKGLGAAHKSELGLVALNISDVDTLTSSALTMNELLRRTDDDSSASSHRAVEQWLVEEMVGDVLAELLVGVVHDPAHGFVLTIGSGGVMTELLRDGVSLLLPVTAIDIEAALTTLKLYPVLTGYRGKPACDLSAIVEQVLAVQRFVDTHRASLVEMEINPLLCTATSAVAADALLILEETV